jgi:hypothetical protein
VRDTLRDITWTSRHTIIVAVLCVAQVLDGIDVTVVNVALPAIKHELRFSQDTLSWVVNAGRTGEEALVDGFAVAFVAAAALMVITAVVAIAMFRDERRGQPVDVIAVQKAELSS